MRRGRVVAVLFFFFFNDTATTEIYTLSLHDALPIFLSGNKMRKSISAKPIIHEGKEIHATMSFGVNEYNGEASIEKTIDLADQRLYLAKNSGRNKVVSEDV